MVIHYKLKNTYKKLQVVWCSLIELKQLNYKNILEKTDTIESTEKETQELVKAEFKETVLRDWRPRGMEGTIRLDTYRLLSRSYLLSVGFTGGIIKFKSTE